jgi:ubiquinone/menaquinone biosynthesis C-methylase UbiE
MQLRSQAARVETKAANLHVYRDPAVVSHYASLDYLTPCERFLFDTYLKPGMAILDIGVGGGRTTPYLSRQAGRYVGVDYSEEMVRLCRDKFPQTEFMIADASDLSPFPDGSFDSVIFAFNGLDYVLPAEKRGQCLKECERVLKAGGALIFSSHNPRSILLRPSWDQRILTAFVRRLVPNPGVPFAAALGAFTVAKSIHASLRAFAGSLARIFRRVPSIAFWRGEGCLIDAAHGELMTHYGTPTHVVAETSRFGFRIETLLGNDYPKRSHQFVTDWYYYVFFKAVSPVGEPCA